MSETTPEASPEPGPPPDATILGWLLQGARSVVLLRPDWTGLRATPALLAGVIVADLVVAIVAGRLYLPSPATFTWHSLGLGWLTTVVNAWACWALTRRAATSAVPSPQPVDAPSLLTLLCFQALVFDAGASCLLVPLLRGSLGVERWSSSAAWTLAIASVCWIALAQARLLWRGAPGATVRARAGIAALVVVVLVLSTHAFPVWYWTPAATTSVAKARPSSAPASGAELDEEFNDYNVPDTPTLKLTQTVFEHQQRLLATQLDAIAPERSGVVDLYAITFAPYADVDVFMRESAVVAGVMESRFDTRGRTLQLVNNVATADRFAWATPLNLQRAIARMAQRMNRDEDILFLHLTSHGGADGHLAAEFFPLTVDELTPQMLRAWLDEAGVRNRVISISACYSGSWIKPLASDDTLVMTAADAEHTSYGCGSKSTLTFFGQAMYDEQLRHTWSFEQAHAASRKLIDQRERVAGKSDGYSNPQISVGVNIRARLKALEARLAASAAK